MKDTLNELLAELVTFPEREEKLRSIYRWHIWKPMYYRPNLFTHGKKVALLVLETFPTVTKVLPNFDLRRALALALVHDDPEMITGDYQAGNKAKMTKGQLAAIDAEERLAIIELSKRFPKTLGGYSYQELQEDIQDLRTPEACVAKFLDVMDGFGEGIHELYAGNWRFTEFMVNEFGTIPLFDELNISRRKGMMEKYPELEALRDKHLFFEISPSLNWKPILENGAPHTLESLYKTAGYPQYDAWKQVILNSDDSEEIKNLYTQQEF